MHPIYLDHAAATPMDPAVLAAMQPYFTDKFYNPSSVYLAAQGVAQDLAAVRGTVAHCIGARPTEVVFTAGGSEANNLALSGVMRRPATPACAKVLVSAIEHDSVLETARQYEHAIIPVTPQGIVDLAALERMIDDDTMLISVMYANNEVGTVQPIKDIAAILHRVRNERARSGSDLPLLLHSDAAQAGNYLDIHVSRLGVDLLTLNGGKLYGPKQSGALYVRAGVRLEPLVYGGGQEQGLRSGTENVAAAVGFATALQIAQDRRLGEIRRLQQLQAYFIQQLQTAIPDVVINGSIRRRLPNNVHITIPGQDNERLLFALDEQGIQAAAGSACSASSDASSHVLLAMCLSDEQARASLRFTLGRQTTQEHIDDTVRVLSGLLA
ncbi:MAG TPA: cysteine desulfurase family protein [Candidatus Saccharimonadales bacterium]|nr:cysteine desulfurase family protein [Candidatus Saccharimonadales bacterium]